MIFKIQINLKNIKIKNSLKSKIQNDHNGKKNLNEKVKKIKLLKVQSGKKKRRKLKSGMVKIF